MAKIFAVAGLPGSGKTTVAKLIERRGYAYYSLGDVVRMEAQRAATAPDRAAVVLRIEEGRRAIVRRLVDIMKRGTNAVVDGVRGIEEVEALEEHLGPVTLIYVVASRETRFRRLAGRGRSDDPSTYSQFLMRDIRELKFGLADLLARADYILVNEGKDIEALEAEVARLL
ncbi:AAA family ATPase [Pyrobaculum neutrophilum]|uniref:Adenylate kinase, conjectural n=1 Tax=Pyrobaculum neutrophilum (strain DSM 2338 / JCM 9278 / NBRC 100436 / V24Sta) TaxID=444157 RepID=B1YCW0_PYRNV|nr:AAA family ATPase [Pyrobaculum neutrophilum]ACB39623.1 adenylate kinase, conjectural [Pyrobaculum neutrophilum V24Sta]